MDDLNRFQSQRNALSIPELAVQYSAGQQQASMQDMAHLNAGLQNTAPDGWYVADTSPSGINRLLPDECRPISLPHNRTLTQANFSAAFWVAAWALLIAGAFTYLLVLAL